ncbi:MAG: endonuclease III domain-containing protein [Deltaproteobacteria bacterium]|nr:endonuclease III domain-containing protein [Deltaproteobacteria bacterium]
MNKEDPKKELLLCVFERLLKAYGKRNWWPAESPLEVMIGCILTQNTAWKNVEKAIANMKKKNLIDLHALRSIDVGELSEVIRPVGFYTLKAKRLKALVDFLFDEFKGDLELMKRMDQHTLRKRLLGVDGVGPETADSILLYALEKPIFVVDAYTRRFLINHGLFDGRAKYERIQAFFMSNLPEDTYIYNEFHALIVYLGQKHCRKVPICKGCPLESGKT